MKAQLSTDFKSKNPDANASGFFDCGGKGIRTPGTREGTTVFKTAAFDRSAIPPDFTRDFTKVKYFKFITLLLTRQTRKIL